MTIYASPTNSMRNPPWDNLSLLAISVNIPWLFEGDLNSIIVTSENEGGSSRIIGVCQHFSDWLFSNKICDLNFRRPLFTWSRGTMHKRLDSASSNDD